MSSPERLREVAMADVRYVEATKLYPGNDAPAVNALDLHIEDGEFMVLVGPSGCGKTTALRMVAGLEDISSGLLKIGDRVVNNVPSRDRAHPRDPVHARLQRQRRLRSAPAIQRHGDARAR